MRFWALVDKTGPNGCWLWTGHIEPSGYGRITRGSKQFRVHRIAYVAAHGEHDPSLVLDHLCRVRHCVNPAHLEPITAGENCLRGVGVAARNATVASCPSGHPYSVENTYRIPSTGGRVCRTCRKARRQEEKVRARRRRERGLGPGRPGRRPQSLTAASAADMKVGV